MEWSQLLSARRIATGGALAPTTATARRSAFQRDADRILFSSAFRRLHDKTQVYPFPENDQVHSRLTHSLEVSSVGRSLGSIVGAELIERHATVLGGFTHHDFGDIVAAACLSHDIGNPPFGHAGEDAIGHYFRALAPHDALQGRARTDLETFEGNAQGFRILTRLQMERDGGMRLSAAVLAAFTKYPREVGDELRVRGDVATKKFGFFQSERETFDAVASETGLVRRDGTALVFARHPLAFLVEAADDICYLVLDLEDGVRLGYAPRRESEDLLAEIASRDERFRAPAADDAPNDRISYLRAKSISRLIDEACVVFLANERALLDGTQRTSLTHSIASATTLAAIRTLTEKHCYTHRTVVEIELAGYEVLAGLLAFFVPAALLPRDALTARDTMLLGLLSLDAPDARATPDAFTERVRRVTDYVSGMTDRFAISLYRKLKGIAIAPSTR